MHWLCYVVLHYLLHCEIRHRHELKAEVQFQCVSLYFYYDFTVVMDAISPLLCLKFVGRSYNLVCIESVEELQQKYTKLNRKYNKKSKTCFLRNLWIQHPKTANAGIRIHLSLIFNKV